MSKVQDRHREAAKAALSANARSPSPLGTQTVEFWASLLAGQEAKTEAEIVAMLEVEIEKCSEFLNRKGKDQDKRIQQENYQDSMYWTIDAIDSGDHRDG